MEGVEGAVLVVLAAAVVAAWPDRPARVEEPPCVEGELREVRSADGPPRLVCRAACPGCAPVSGASLLLLGRPVDVNTAGEADLRAIPGLGPALARRIVREREAGGPFRSLDDLARVRGLGEARVRSLAPWLVAAPFPARYNGRPATRPLGVPRADSLREVRDALQPR